ncbi:MAG TPA: SIS domain-containing protein, partial [Ktedonobacteraceae bacterium]|nr:SIS domain-containing protein [Ktedonobacteraceae bacterium]
MAYWRSYMEEMIKAQEAIMEHEALNIEEAAKVITRALRQGGVLHMFGSGHSHLPPEEAFYRSGGLAAVSPLLDP